MDVKNRITERVFPDTDYDKSGNLKPVRGRTLKTLLKYEVKAIKKTLLLCGILMLGFTLFLMGFIIIEPDFMRQYLLLEEITDPTLIGISIAFLGWVICLVGSQFAVGVVAFQRYEKNFFKEEGYLTWSIPASAEEQVLAKHITGIVSNILTLIFAGVCVGLVLLLTQGFVGTEEGVVEVVSFFDVVTTVAQIIEFFIVAHFVMGAITCFGYKITKKSTLVLLGVLFYVIIMIIDWSITALIANGIVDFFFTPVGKKIGSWLGIVFGLGVAYLCYLYEVKRLKKLDLK